MINRKDVYNFIKDCDEYDCSGILDEIKKRKEYLSCEEKILIFKIHCDYVYERYEKHNVHIMKDDFEKLIEEYWEKYSNCSLSMKDMRDNINYAFPKIKAVLVGKTEYKEIFGEAG